MSYPFEKDRCGVSVADGSQTMRKLVFSFPLIVAGMLERGPDEGVMLIYINTAGATIVRAKSTLSPSFRSIAGCIKKLVGRPIVRKALEDGAPFSFAWKLHKYISLPRLGNKLGRSKTRNQHIYLWLLCQDYELCKISPSSVIIFTF